MVDMGEVILNSVKKKKKTGVNPSAVQEIKVAKLFIAILVYLFIYFISMDHYTFIWIVGGGVQTGSTRHVGHLLAY
jgi:hypothetical protein